MGARICLLSSSPWNIRDAFFLCMYICKVYFFLFLELHTLLIGASLVAQMVKILPAMQETWVQSLGWEDPLEEEMASNLA